MTNEKYIITGTREDITIIQTALMIYEMKVIECRNNNEEGSYNYENWEEVREKTRHLIEQITKAKETI